MSYDRNQNEKPMHRSKLRTRLGKELFGLKRRVFWIVRRRVFAKDVVKPLPYCQFQHRTPLLRQLKDIDMKYQYNKTVNLKIAAKKIDGIVIHPGEIFSYWKLIGNPRKRKGYLEGMVLQNGHVETGIGGGLCQLSNLIYWMTLHTPLTVVERHRHGYDVFPDSDRSQPFGSGATCFYPYIDLMIQNNTEQDFQLKILVGESDLEGEWRAETPVSNNYQIIERNHKIVAEYWGGYTRRNELHRLTLDSSGLLLKEELVAQNNAIMMYAPFLSN
jgi:vancomycin resistance protein VanW